MAELDQQLISAIASQKLGPPPGAPAGAPQGIPPGAPPGPPPSPKADPSPTDIERAQSKVAPAEAGGNEATTDIKFVNIGGRDYTEQQLQGTLARYPKANAELQMNKPILDISRQIMEMAKANGHDPQPHEVAGLMDAALRAFIKNPQMGGDQKQGGDKGGAKPAMSGNEDNSDDQYSQWEKENAVKLPPGFKEMGGQMKQMMALIQQMAQGGMGGQQATQQAQQAMQKAQQTHQQAQVVQGDAVTKMISTNLNQAFQQAGLGTDPQSRSDFQMFAAQRGYDFPDFVDPQMTATVVADFKAVKDAPEMGRMREIMSKRQAFTGSMESAPGAGGAPAAPAGDPMLAQLVDSAMAKRNGR
jgi:hypothetical protein